MNLHHLRSIAEEKLNQRKTRPRWPAGAEKAEVAYELELRQLELELQNEELRRVNRTLEAAGDRSDAAFHYAPLPLAVADVDGNLVRVNARFADLVERPSEELVGQPVSAFASQTDCRAIHQLLRSSNRHPAPQKITLRNPAGWPVRGRIWVSKYESSSAVTLGFIPDGGTEAAPEGTALDADLCETFVRSTDVAAVILDRFGAIKLFNSAAERAFGYTSDEVNGESFRLLLAATDRQIIDSDAGGLPLQQVMRDRLGTIQVARRRDGCLFPVEVSVAVLEGSELFVLTVRDVTRQRMLEDVRQRERRLESMRTFAVGVSHELNNLLMGISGSIELARQKSTNDAAEPYFNRILAAVDGAAQMSGRLIAFARRNRGHQHVCQVDRSLQRLQPQIELLAGDGVAVEVAFGAGESTIEADPFELDEIVLQLARNACEAMTDGGELRIESRLSSPSGKDDHPAVRIRVTDTGCGIWEEDLDRIYEPFFTRKPVGTHAGLGLSMVYGFATSLGGRIYVDSAVGVGTIVELVLPAA